MNVKLILDSTADIADIFGYPNPYNNVGWYMD